MIKYRPDLKKFYQDLNGEFTVYWQNFFNYSFFKKLFRIELSNTIISVLRNEINDNKYYYVKHF